MTPEEQSERERQWLILEERLVAAQAYTAAHPGSLRIVRCLMRDSIFLVWIKDGHIVCSGPSMHWN